MKNEYFEKALRIVQNRRTNARTQQEERIRKIEQEIPEITEIHYQLFQTNRKLLQILGSRKDASAELAKLEHENLQAQRLISMQMAKHGYPEDYLEIHYTCPKCFDTGYYNSNYCSCLMQLVSQFSMEELNQSVKFENCTFSNFNLEYYRDKKDSIAGDCYAKMQENFEICKAYATNFTLNSPNLLMYGKTGLGKTHLSLAIANEVLQHGYNVLYDSVINFFHQVENEHFSKKDFSDDTLNQLLNTDLLILDDLGTEFHSPFYTSILYNIVNTRMNRSRPTIISTNLSLPKQEILNTYDERISSRLLTGYRGLYFAGEDVRALKMMEKQLR